MTTRTRTCRPSQQLATVACQRDKRRCGALTQLCRALIKRDDEQNSPHRRANLHAQVNRGSVKQFRVGVLACVAPDDTNTQQGKARVVVTFSSLINLCGCASLRHHSTPIRPSHLICRACTSFWPSNRLIVSRASDQDDPRRDELAND